MGFFLSTAIAVLVICARFGDGALGGFGFMLCIFPGIGMAGGVGIVIYLTIENLWIIRQFRRGTNPYLKSQFQLRKAVRNLSITCVAFLGAIIFFAFGFYRVHLFAGLCFGLIPGIYTYFHGRDIFKSFCEVGRLEEVERCEREGTAKILSGIKSSSPKI